MIFHVNHLPRQRIHMKKSSLILMKNKSKNIKVPSAAIFVWRFKG